MRIPSWCCFRFVSNWLSTCQFPSPSNDRDTNTIAKLLIPNMLLIRQAALLEVERGWGDICGNANMRARTLSHTHGFADNEECLVFLKISLHLINSELPH